MFVPWWLPFGRVEEIAPKVLEAKLGNGARPQLIDVREKFEFDEGHIRGAKNVPIRDLPRQLDSLALDYGRPVVAICLTGHRSVPAYRLLKRKGFDEVYSLSGGMISWRRLHLPTSRTGSR